MRSILVNWLSKLKQLLMIELRTKFLREFTAFPTKPQMIRKMMRDLKCLPHQHLDHRALYYSIPGISRIYPCSPSVNSLLTPMRHQVSWSLLKIETSDNETGGHLLFSPLRHCKSQGQTPKVMTMTGSGNLKGYLIGKLGVPRLPCFQTGLCFWNDTLVLKGQG